MDGLKNRETIIKYISFSGLIFLSVILIAVRPVLFVLIVRGNSVTELSHEQMGLLSLRFSLAGIMQAFISILLVIKFQKNGFWAQIFFNSLSILQVLWMSAEHPAIMAISGIAGSCLAILISIILYRQLDRIKDTIAELDRMTFSDDLTGLANRKKIISVITNLISGEKTLSGFSIMFIDMDNFKTINDSLGHQIGDIFLNEVVHNIKPFLSAGMTFGRMGGDEFLIVVPFPKSDAELMSLGRTVNKAVSMPFLFKSRNYVVTCSIGMARFPEDGKTVSELLRFADIALYQAKLEGRNRCLFFNDTMRSKLEKKIQMEHELHFVLENRELYIEYQPQFFLANRKLRGFEVLTRWNSPLLGSVEPSVFIPLAEENGDIIAIGKWILLQSISDYMKMYTSFDPSPVLAVNISVMQFRDSAFLDDVKEILGMTKMNPENLEFEITESVCLTSPETARKKLQEIHNLGIKIALDDFGTGYSSLSYLRLLPFNILKIDKSFTDTILSVPEKENLVKTIITMAHQLGLFVVAEGVEQKEQLKFLLKYNCDIIQGNYFSKPVPVFAL
jgi:diguanylate cyclase (GGDEF)-like protein